MSCGVDKRERQRQQSVRACAGASEQQTLIKHGRESCPESKQNVLEETWEPVRRAAGPISLRVFSDLFCINIKTAACLLQAPADVQE